MVKCRTCLYLSVAIAVLDGDGSNLSVYPRYRSSCNAPKPSASVRMYCSTIRTRSSLFHRTVQDIRPPCQYRNHHTSHVATHTVRIKVGFKESDAAKATTYGGVQACDLHVKFSLGLYRPKSKCPRSETWTVVRGHLEGFSTDHKLSKLQQQ